MCEHIVDVVLLATGAEIGVVLLVEDFSGSARLRVGAQRGLKNPFIDMAKALNSIAPMIDPTQGTIIAYREDEVYGDLPFLSSHSQTILICPMVQGGLLLGAIWLETSSATAFNAEEVQFVEQISHQSLIVLENARLFQRIESDRDQLATLLDTMEEGLMMINRQGRIVIANPQMSLIGVDPDLLTSRSYFECVAAPGVDLHTQLGFNSIQDAERAIRKLHEDGGENAAVEYNLQSDSGVKHIERRRVPIYSDNGEWLGVILVFYDRTVQYELERSREELTHMIIHDLRSPLTTVTTSLRLINTTIPKDSPYWSVVESTTEVSHRAIRKILNRVNSMLDIAKMQSGKLALNYEQIDLIPLVQGVLSDMLPIAVDMQVRIELQAPQNSIMLTADADKIERVVMNLVDNALKYSPSDGIITVRIDRSAAPDRIKVDVVDEGPGIPAEYKTKLFESFMQIEGSTPRRGGVGLGLTFCKLVVDAHRGQLWIEDNPGGGSIFSLTLPTHVGMA
jgi:signal transduction histidine kinase